MSFNPWQKAFWEYSGSCSSMRRSSTACERYATSASRSILLPYIPPVTSITDPYVVENVLVAPTVSYFSARASTQSEIACSSHLYASTKCTVSSCSVSSSLIVSERGTSSSVTSTISAGTRSPCSSLNRNPFSTDSSMYSFESPMIYVIRAPIMLLIAEYSSMVSICSLE